MYTSTQMHFCVCWSLFQPLFLLYSFCRGLRSSDFHESLTADYAYMMQCSLLRFWVKSEKIYITTHPNHSVNQDILNVYFYLFLIICGQRTRDLQRRFVCCHRQKKTEIFSCWVNVIIKILQRNIWQIVYTVVILCVNFLTYYHFKRTTTHTPASS